MFTPSLITNKSNINYLSNFNGSAGFMLITKSKKYLFTDSRYILRAKSDLKNDVTLIDSTRMFRNKDELEKNWKNIFNKHKIKELGIEESDLTISRFKFFKKMIKTSGVKVKYKNISGQLEKLREQKDEEEINKIKKSQAINDQVFTKIKNFLKKNKGEKISEIEIAFKIKEWGFKLGAEEVSFDPIVAFDKNSASPHHSPGKSILKKNSMILIDMGFKFEGYCSDMTRVLFLNEVSDKQKKIYNLVLKSQENCIQNIKADISGERADQFLREIIDKEGYGENFSHAGGHGVGLDIHESPALSVNYKEKILPNTVLTVEPGIYLAKEFGVRIEDMLLVRKNDVENLTSSAKKIEDVIL